MFPQPRGDINIYISRREILLIFDCYSCWKYFSYQFYHCYIVTVQMVAVHTRSLFVYPALTLRNWIDSREMWNFNTNRAEQSAVTGDQRDKLNIYISRCPRVQPCVLFRLRELFHFTNCWFVRSDRRQVSPKTLGQMLMCERRL